MSTLQETIDDLMLFCEGKKYSTIYADPPWRFQNRTGKVAPEHKRLNRYDTMDLAGIEPLLQHSHICSDNMSFTILSLFIREIKFKDAAL